MMSGLMGVVCCRRRALHDTECGIGIGQWLRLGVIGKQLCMRFPKSSSPSRTACGEPYGYIP